MSPSPSSVSRLLLVSLLAFAALVAALSQRQLQGDSFAPMVDSEAYLLQGLRVAAGHDIVEGVYFQAPLYPLLLGGALGLMGVPGSLLAQRIEDLDAAVLEQATRVGRGLNVVAGLALVWLLWRLGRRLFDDSTGRWAALLAALYGPFLFYQAHLLKVSLSLLFLPWAVLALVRAMSSGRSRPFLWVGLALGLGGLVRGNMHLLLPLAALALWIHGWRGGAPGRGVRRVAWLFLGAALAVAPVVLRNSVVAGYPVFSTAAGGTAFYLCNHTANTTGLVEATALNRQVPRHEFGDWEQGAEQALGRPLSPAQISSYWFGLAVDEIAANPGSWALTELRKVGLLCSRYEAPDNTMVALGEEQSWLLAWTPSRWALVLPLFLGGAWLALRRQRRGQQLASEVDASGSPAEAGGPSERDRWDLALGPRPAAAEDARRAGRLALLLAMMGYAASLLLFNVSARFRMPLAPLAMVFAAYLLARLPGILVEIRTGGWSAARLQGLGGVSLMVVLGVGASLVSEGPLGPLDRAELATHKAVRYKNRAQVAAGRGDLRTARADLQRALQVAAEAGRVSPDLFVLGASWDRAEALSLSAAGETSRAAPLRARAISAVSQALAIRPDHGPAQRLAGLLLYDEGAYLDAVSSFEGALAAVPRDREARQYLVLSLLALERYAEARDGAEWLIADDPSQDDGPGLLAMALLGLGDRDGARRALEESERLASMRAAAGLPRRLPVIPALRELRQESDPP